MRDEEVLFVSSLARVVRLRDGAPRTDGRPVMFCKVHSGTGGWREKSNGWKTGETDRSGSPPRGRRAAGNQRGRRGAGGG